jgi:hypothetical protein
MKILISLIKKYQSDSKFFYKIYSKIKLTKDGNQYYINTNNMIINLFNDKVYFLEILYKYSINIYNENLIPLSQDELANICRFSKSKINKYLREFTNLGLVKTLPQNHSRYLLTEKAILLLHNITLFKEQCNELF